MGTKMVLAVNLVVMSLIAGLVLGMSPVGAHINNKMGHVFRHVKDKVGLTWEERFGESSSDSPKTELVFCEDGKEAVGGGVAVRTDDEQVAPEVAISRTEPIDGPDPSDPDGVSGWYAEATETTPTDVEWSLFVKVYCANL